MQLKHASRTKPLISLVPMIDVLLILLVFFMVTSTYLDLDMVPVGEAGDAPGAGTGSEAQVTRPTLARLGADGTIRISGRTYSMTEFERHLAVRLTDSPETEVVLLPSGRATTQTLTSAMDAATTAGVTRLRIVRLEPRP